MSGSNFNCFSKHFCFISNPLKTLSLEERRSRIKTKNNSMEFVYQFNENLIFDTEVQSQYKTINSQLPGDPITQLFSNIFRISKLDTQTKFYFTESL